VLYDPNEKMPAILAGLDQAFRPHRGKAVGRHRAITKRQLASSLNTRPAEPRDHLDRQSHLSLCAGGLAGGHCPSSTTDLDDPACTNKVF